MLGRPWRNHILKLKLGPTPPAEGEFFKLGSGDRLRKCLEEPWGPGAIMNKFTQVESHFG